MGVNITIIAYLRLRVLTIEIGSTIILMVVEAQGSSFPTKCSCQGRRSIRDISVTSGGAPHMAIGITHVPTIFRFSLYGGVLKWWVFPTTMGFPIKNDHLGCEMGVPPFKETPIYLENRALQHSDLRFSRQ